MAQVPVPRQRRSENPVDDHASLLHDLRQCVTAGLLLSQLPTDDVLDAETRRRFSLLQRTLTHAGDLLDSAVADERPEPGPVDLVDLVHRCVGVAELRHKIRVENELSHPVTVTGHPVLLHRAIDNMIDNAGRASGPSGAVLVRVGATDDDAWLEVSDDGPGFGKIEHGTGQGLSIITSAVHASAGRLEITTGPGPGTTVRVTLPLSRGSVVS